jgi:UDP-galactopyranose mutase
MKRCIIIGAGFSGSVIAERLASAGISVIVLERREHIGGNAYDRVDENGVLIHEYGPHMFFTDKDSVWNYISNFGEWYNYVCYNLVEIDKKLVPFPFNINSIEMLFGSKANKLKEKLITLYGQGSQIPILTLMQEADDDIADLARFLYNKDFLPYTKKQWDLLPEENDASVTARVPIRVDRDNRLLRQKYQYLPKGGFTSVFEKLLNHKNIEIKLEYDALKNLRVDLIKKEIFWDNVAVDFPVIYTGALDELLNYSLGVLPYRSLIFKKEIKEFKYLPTCIVTYPHESYEYTRASEYRYMMQNQPSGMASPIIYEIPTPYTPNSNLIPFYPYVTEESQQLFGHYERALSDVKHFYRVGRLAEYKYINMDQVIDNALRMAQYILNREFNNVT